MSAVFWEVERNWATGDKPDWQECSFRPRSSDAQSAAEEWAHQHDGEGDYTIVGGSDAHLRVRRSQDDEAPWEEFLVEGRMERSYYARTTGHGKYTSHD